MLGSKINRWRPPMPLAMPRVVFYSLSEQVIRHDGVPTSQSDRTFGSVRNETVLVRDKQVMLVTLNRECRYGLFSIRSVDPLDIFFGRFKTVPRNEGAQDEDQNV